MRRYYIIQYNAVLFLLGYLLMHAVSFVAFGGASRTASIAYDAFQSILSLYVICICYRDFFIEPQKPLFSALAIIMILYTVRIYIDIFSGPFSRILSKQVMWNDFLQIVGVSFLPTWSLICSRKYINIEIISNGVFWVGLAVCVLTTLGFHFLGMMDSLEEERMSAGGGLNTLALAKIGAIEIIAALYMLFNYKKNKIIYFVGLAIGFYVMMASGSRGGVAGLVIAIAVYLTWATRKKQFLMLIGVITVVLFFVNLIPILIWLSDYFPIFSNRMLATIIEADQSGRQELREQALKLIFENPIFGYGYRLNADITGFGPHNGILEIFLCLGIPVGIFFTYFVYAKGVWYALLMMADRRFIFASLMAIFSIVSSMSSNSLSTGSFDFALVFIGIAYYYHFRYSPSHSINKHY